MPEDVSRARLSNVRKSSTTIPIPNPLEAILKPSAFQGFCVQRALRSDGDMLRNDGRKCQEDVYNMSENSNHASSNVKGSNVKKGSDVDQKKERVQRIRFCAEAFARVDKHD